MSARLDAALDYCDQARSIIPVEPGGKLPAIPWRRYQAERASPDRIAHWWGRADWNVGVVTGQISNLVCIDVDFRHHGTGALAKPEATHDTLATAEVATPNGVHLWFTHPGVRISNSAGVARPRAGRAGRWRVRGRSAQRARRWRLHLVRSDPARGSGHGPAADMAGPAADHARTAAGQPAATHLWSHGDRRQRYLQAAITGILDQLARARPEATDGTGRNDQLFRAAVRVLELQRQGAPESWIATIEEAGLRLGLDQAEVAKTIRSARKRVGP